MDKIKVRLNADFEVLQGAEILSEKLGIIIDDGGTVINAVKSESLSVMLADGEYTVTYSILPEFFRGLAICADSIRSGSFIPKKEIRQFETCGTMLDMSRNAVMTVDSVKDMLGYMAIMGLNMLMLYTEDTYEIEGYPMFGFMRGKYTKAELKELDSYALKLGIELIPCIQTLSHLEATLGWSYAAKFRDTARTMYVGKEETYAFIEEMFKSVRECFSTKRIHIGLDEANDVGLGKRLKEKGYTPAFDLMVEHVNRVCELADKYDLQPMMWSDMFFKFGKLGGDYDHTSVIPDGTADKLAENIELVYWDYCYEDPKVANLFLTKHREELKRETVFAGGIWTWNRMTTSYVKTFDTARGQLKACKENGVRTVFATVWNNTCSLFNIYSILPGLQMYAEQFYNKEVSDSQLAKMFEICTGWRFDDFMLLGLDDFTPEILSEHKGTSAFCVNSSAQHFFNDVLMGLMDKTLSGFDFKAYYKKYLKGLKALGDMGKMNDLFRQTKLLTEILIAKSTLGPDITAAYKAGDSQKLATYCGELKELIALYEEYHEISMRIWHSVNKPFGWEGCDMVLSGAEARIKTAIYRIEGYLDGSFDRIEELEAERIWYRGCEKPLTETNKFSTITTVCSM